MILLQLDTGIRPGEALALRPPDIIQKFLAASISPLVTKTRVDRIVVFSPQTARALVALVDITHPETGEVIVPVNEVIDFESSLKIRDSGLNRITIRSVLTCKSRFGVCINCYGRNLATGRMVDIGEAVGIIAAQSIGEPEIQLTMRTFHSGGVAGDDITQGLSRVEELFEARRPKGQAIVAEYDGVVEVREAKGRREIETTVWGLGRIHPFSCRAKCTRPLWLSSGVNDGRTLPEKQAWWGAILWMSATQPRLALRVSFANVGPGRVASSGVFRRKPLAG